MLSTTTGVRKRRTLRRRKTNPYSHRRPYTDRPYSRARAARLPMIAPPSMMVKLNYRDTDTEYLVGTGVTSVSGYYKINSAYDVNGAVASSSMPGFNDWNRLYSKYRVHSTRIEVTFINTSTAEPMYCGLTVQGPGVGAPSGWAQFIESAGNPLNKQKLLNYSPAYGGMATLATYVDFGTYFGGGQKGRGEYLNDQNNASLINANPVNVYTCRFYYTDLDNSTTLPAILPIKGSVTMNVEFYERPTQYS